MEVGKLGLMYCYLYQYSALEKIKREAIKRQMSSDSLSGVL